MRGVGGRAIKATVVLRDQSRLGAQTVVPRGVWETRLMCVTCRCVLASEHTEPGQRH